MRFVREHLMRSGLVRAGALLLGCSWVSQARAAGIEDTVGGTVGLGRAAYYARVNDFMAVLQNPANLSVIPKGDLGLELRLPILTACYDRAKNNALDYKQDENGELIETFGVVCNDASPSPTANLGWAQSYQSGLGWGVGLFTPAASGTSKYGSDVIRTVYPLDTEMYEQTTQGLESPSRQMGMERQGVIAYLMAGVGYQLADSFRVGASVGFGLSTVFNKSVVSVQGGTFADQEVVNELRVKDYFIPRAVLSAAWTPLDSVDVFATLAYHADMKAEGHTVLTANGLRGAPTRSCFDETPGSRCRIDGARLEVPFPTWEATFGLRYAQRRNPRQRVLDPMKDEIWDIEVDAAWAQTSNVDQFSVNLHDRMVGSPGSPRVQFGNGMGAASSFIRNSTSIPKHWRDTWSVRVGGDYNIVPEKLAIRLGVSYATRASPLEYVNIDYWPVQKLGLHTGMTWAFKSYRVSLAYAHLIYQKIIVGLGDGGVKDIATIDEDESTAVNEGRFTAAQNILSLQLSATFR